MKFWEKLGIIICILNLINRATLCTLTKQKLRKPIVSCKLGFFYNKENVLQSLIQKNLPKEFAHISSLKDIVDVNIKENEKQNATFQFMCPLSQIEYNGLNKFVLLWSCGCVLSEKAFIETKEMSKNKCVLCNKSYSKDDILSLNMSVEEQERIKEELIRKKVAY